MNQINQRATEEVRVFFGDDKRDWDLTIIPGDVIRDKRDGRVVVLQYEARVTV